MTIEEQFNRIAAEYDSGRRKFIPCFDAFYRDTTDFIAASMAKRCTSIVDLGAGTGILDREWMRHFPNAHYTLVDVAGEMLDVARKRFNGITGVDYLAADYSKSFDALSRAVHTADVVISALSIHHLEDSGKTALFINLYNALPAGALFVNYDQFCAASSAMDRCYTEYWEGQIASSGLTVAEIAKWQSRRVLDRECSVEKETAMMRQAGFDAECVYHAQKFAVIAARRMDCPAQLGA